MTVPSTRSAALGPDAAPALLAGGCVLLLGLLDRLTTYADQSLVVTLPVTIVLALAAALHRLAPAAALALVWVAGLGQLAVGAGTSLAQLGVLVVAFGCARYGGVATLWLSGLSLPCGAILTLGTAYVSVGAFSSVQVRAGIALGDTFTGYRALLVGFVLLTAVLAVPWVLGLALRLRARSEQDERQRLVAEEQRSVAIEEREQAEEIARLREDQTRLARDVHDVVGHSLAVILAQAESAQFRPETDSAAIRTTLADIAVTARQSLRDVRDVLSSTDGTTAVATTRAGDLDALVEGVRAAGNDVRSRVVGVPRPLPPELDVVAFRVLQEMLTNALKHGRRGEPVLVERHWEGELRLEVCNVVADPPPTEDTQPLHAATAGRGLDGMRRRLESVGGRLDVRRREEPGAPTYTATAWVPLRDGAVS